MPSEAFMQEILGSEEAQRARDEASEDLTQELPAEEEEAEDEEGTDEEAEGDEDEVVEEAGDEPPADDEEEADEETDAVHGEEGDYGSFQNLDELKRGYKETRAFAQEQSRARAQLERELQETRELLAYQSGRAETGQGGMAPADSEQFSEWAEGAIEDNPERGLAEVMQYGDETGDWSYAAAYADMWGESDPYRASNARNVINMAVALGRGGPQQDQPQTGVSGVAYDREAASSTISAAYHTLQNHYPDLAEGSPVLGGVVQVIAQDARLHSMVRSGDFDDTVWAIEMARERYLASQPRRGRPRASRAAQEALAADKAATQMPRGGARPSSRTGRDNGAVPPEFQDAMNQFAKWGMVRESE